MHKELDIDNREKSSFRKLLLARPIFFHKVIREMAWYH